MTGKLEKQVHELVIKLSWVVYFSNILKGETLHQVHDNAMSVKIYWCWNWEPSVFQSLHVCKLLGSRYPRQVQPVHTLPVFVIISFLSHFPETGSSQPVQLETGLPALLIPHYVDVRLLASPNLVPKRSDDIPGHQCLQSKVVIASISESVPIISVTSLIGQQPVFTQLPQYLVHPSMPQASYGGYQRSRN